MTKRTLASTLLTLALAGTALAVPAGARADTRAERQARREIKAGNKLYNEKRYADAEVAYSKALEAEPGNAVAQLNLASAFVRQAIQGESGDELREKARKLYSEVLASAPKESVAAQQAAYNLGNMAFNDEQWAQAINFYKEALRRDPADEKARENLRLAQLKKQQQDQNQDQNQDQDQKQDDKHDQKQDQQQDQNKDQQQDQNKDQQQNQNQDQQKDQQPQQQQPSGLSRENAEKILKAMENEEAATRRKVQEAEKKEKERSSRRTVLKPW